MTQVCAMVDCMQLTLAISSSSLLQVQLTAGVVFSLNDNLCTLCSPHGNNEQLL